MELLTAHPFIRQTTADKALGALIGSALGDAIGVYTEFLPKTACLKAYPTAKFSLLPSNLTSFREDSHRDKFEPGDWTDDTDQALSIVLSFLHSRSGKENGDVGKEGELAVDPQDVAVRINSWITQGLRALDRPPLGIGQTIGRVVLDPEYLSSPAVTALKIWLKSNRNAAPNGSLMRTHPLGVFCVGLSEEAAFEVAAEVGRTTHIDPRCVVSCCLQVALLRGILRGEIRGEKDVDACIERAWKWVESKDAYKNPESKPKKEEADAEWEEVGERPKVVVESLLNREEYQKHCYAKSLTELQLDDGQKMGYVYKCLATAIFSLRMAMRLEGKAVSLLGPEVFEELITELIMEGGDADTNACVAGALLGAWVGYSRLPAHWEKGIHNRQWLLKKSHAVLYRLGMLEDGDGKWRGIVENDPDTALDGGRGFLSKTDLDRREKDFVMMILLKQKARRDELAKNEQAKKKKWETWFK